MSEHIYETNIEFVKKGDHMNEINNFVNVYNWITKYSYTYDIIYMKILPKLLIINIENSLYYSEIEIMEDIVDILKLIFVKLGYLKKYVMHISIDDDTIASSKNDDKDNGTTLKEIFDEIPEHVQHVFIWEASTSTPLKYIQTNKNHNLYINNVYQPYYEDEQLIKIYKPLEFFIDINSIIDYSTLTNLLEKHKLTNYIKQYSFRKNTIILFLRPSILNKITENNFDINYDYFLCNEKNDEFRLFAYKKGSKLFPPLDIQRDIIYVDDNVIDHCLDIPTNKRCTFLFINDLSNVNKLMIKDLVNKMVDNNCVYWTVFMYNQKTFIRELTELSKLSFEIIDHKFAYLYINNNNFNIAGFMRTFVDDLFKYDVKTVMKNNTNEYILELNNDFSIKADKREIYKKGELHVDVKIEDDVINLHKLNVNKHNQSNITWQYVNELLFNSYMNENFSQVKNDKFVNYHRLESKHMDQLPKYNNIFTEKSIFVEKLFQISTDKNKELFDFYTNMIKKTNAKLMNTNIYLSINIEDILKCINYSKLYDGTISETELYNYYYTYLIIYMYGFTLFIQSINLIEKFYDKSDYLNKCYEYYNWTTNIYYSMFEKNNNNINGASGYKIEIDNKNTAILNNFKYFRSILKTNGLLLPNELFYILEDPVNKNLKYDDLMDHLCPIIQMNVIGNFLLTVKVTSSHGTLVENSRNLVMLFNKNSNKYVLKKLTDEIYVNIACYIHLNMNNNGIIKFYSPDGFKCIKLNDKLHTMKEHFKDKYDLTRYNKIYNDVANLLLIIYDEHPVIADGLSCMSTDKRDSQEYIDNLKNDEFIKETIERIKHTPSNDLIYLYLAMYIKSLYTLTDIVDGTNFKQSNVHLIECLDLSFDGHNKQAHMNEKVVHVKKRSVKKSTSESLNNNFSGAILDDKKSDDTRKLVKKTSKRSIKKKYKKRVNKNENNESDKNDDKSDKKSDKNESDKNDDENDKKKSDKRSNKRSKKQEKNQKKNKCECKKEPSIIEHITKKINKSSKKVVEKIKKVHEGTLKEMDDIDNFFAGNKTVSKKNKSNKNESKNERSKNERSKNKNKNETDTGGISNWFHNLFNKK